MPCFRKMPCPVTVRSGITSKNYEDVIGKLRIGEDVIGELNSVLLLFGCNSRKGKEEKEQETFNRLVILQV